MVFMLKFQRTYRFIKASYRPNSFLKNGLCYKVDFAIHIYYVDILDFAAFFIRNKYIFFIRKNTIKKTHFTKKKFLMRCFSVRNRKKVLEIKQYNISFSAPLIPHLTVSTKFLIKHLTSLKQCLLKRNWSFTSQVKLIKLKSWVFIIHL